MASLTEVTAPLTWTAEMSSQPTTKQEELIPELLSDLTLRSAIQALFQEALPHLPHLPHLPYLSSFSHASPLDSLDWLPQLSTDAHMVMDKAGLLSPNSRGGLFAEDHLFKALIRNGMMQDNRILFAPQQGSHGCVYNVCALARDVCGHKGIVHGGLTSAIIDETFGYVLYLVHQQHTLQALNLTTAMTAHLEIDYKKPLPAASTCVCVAEVESVEGRKLRLKAQLLDRPGGTVFATGKALFVVPRPRNGDTAAAAGVAAAETQPAQGAAGEPRAPSPGGSVESQPEGTEADV